jgi:hypothetical protein
MAFGDESDLKQIAQLLVATTVEASLTVTPGRPYSLLHLGVVGAAGTPTPEAIYFAFESGAVVATAAAGVNKLMLPDGVAIPLPPGLRTISYKTASADVAFQIVAGPPYHGDY